MKVAVIGAGPAGMTTAYQLAKTGVEVEVFEASPVPGGMARTMTLWNQLVDTGPHRFFSKDRRVNELWLEVVGRDYRIVDRMTRIFYQQKFYSYPLNPLNALKNIGVIQAIACILYYLKEKILPTQQDGSFEAWVTHRFGKRLYEVFFKSYSEKLWGIPCSDIDSDFASQRIKKLSLFEVVKNALLKETVIKHRTLVEQFAYPCSGTGSIYKKMADFVEKHGGKIYYQTPVESVKVNGQMAVHALTLSNGEIRSGYDHIVSTMPLTLLVSRLDQVPSEVKEAVSSLHFRNTILVYLNIDAQDLFPDQWIYVQSPEFRTGRITNFRNWVPELYGSEKSTVLLMEYWCNSDDEIWKDSSDALIALAVEEFNKLGFKKAEVLGGHVERISRSYPVYRKGYKKHIKIIEQYLKSIDGLSVIGRYGAFKYNNQDHSMLMGLLAAANIAKGENNDLWEINTDYEDYQESFVINKTGLVKG